MIPSLASTFDVAAATSKLFVELAVCALGLGPKGSLLICYIRRKPLCGPSRKLIN